MNQAVVEQALDAFKSFNFERGHELFLREVENALKTLPENYQAEFASLLELYEEAYHNCDVIRIADLICYYIFPLTVHA